MDDDARKIVRETLKVLDSSERWLEIYSMSSALTPSERRTIKLAFKYIQAIRLHCADSRFRVSELQRRRRKLERACWKLHLVWLESGRR